MFFQKDQIQGSQSLGNKKERPKSQLKATMLSLYHYYHRSDAESFIQTFTCLELLSSLFHDEDQKIMTSVNVFGQAWKALNGYWIC